MNRSALALTLCAALAWSGTGCKNNNLFGGLHREGSGDAVSQVADGQAALTSGEYAKALAYFEAALAQDPTNSDALYGAAVAEMGASGLNMGQLLSNLMTQGTPGGAPALTTGLSAAAQGAPSLTHTVDPNSILNGIDVPSLDAALERALCYMQRLQLGLSDGRIPANDANLLINLGLCRLLHAATHPLQQDITDIRKSSNGQDFEYALVASNPLSVGQCAVVVNSYQDIAWGYQSLRLAVTDVLKQAPGDTLYDLTTDLGTLYTQYKVTDRKSVV